MKESKDTTSRLPNFFIIGAAKAGTTSLHALLSRHPKIFMPNQKEPEFFARDDRYSMGLEFYLREFSGAREDQIVGEASTIYTLSPFFPKTAARIFKHAPDAKFIYILRDPVDRAFSFYIQILKNYQNDTGDYKINRCFEDFVIPDMHFVSADRSQAFASFDSHLPDDPELCLAGSDYLFQIKEYVRYFDLSQFLFLKFEDFKNDPGATIGKITRFLEIPDVDIEKLSNSNFAKNISSQHFDEVARTKAIQGISRRAGVLWGVRKIIPNSLRKSFRGLLLRNTDRLNSYPPNMDDSTRKYLEARYSQQIPELSELTKLKLDNWMSGPVNFGR